MVDVVETVAFANWFGSLRDDRAAARIAQRIARIRAGNFGDMKAVGEGVSEVRIDYGPGYRLYFARRGGTVVILLCGEDKSTQASDIARAKRMQKEL